MERKLKHLELIQGVINRMANTSFLLKGWSVVLVSALFAVGVSIGPFSRENTAVIALLPCLVFWGLDGYYLEQERRHRRLYDRVRELPPEAIDFSMDTSFSPGGFEPWLRATFSKTVAVFHGAVLLAVLLVILSRFLQGPPLFL
jgi:hypothetical protein